ncbi:MAG: PQQ-binding-like beta-propeller repeat protein [Chloroflexi bacterium]|nr:PQQ-binding-like beta-propeller repeat protein [Chloroflexota bacterium]
MTTVGTVIGEYIAQEPLGSSGLATVFRASHSRTDQTVALKVLHSYFAHERALVQRYFGELERARGFPHPNILPVLDWGQQPDGAVWSASEFAPEGTLRTTWMSSAPVAEALHVVAGVAEALEHLLAHGLTHRNLKPSNVFWDARQRTVRLGDFGMVTLGEGAHPLVRTALTTPLPTFMAPEYIADGHADARSETFSLAVLAYWLLAGAVPYPAEAPATMYAKAMRNNPALPSALNPRVSHEVDRVILRALAPFPTVRPGGPGQFAEALRQAAGQPEPLPQGGDAAPVAAQEDRTGVALPTAPVTEPPHVPGQPTAEELEHLWRPLRTRNLRKERLVQAVLLVALVAAATLGSAAWNKPPEIPPPSTTVSAEVRPGQWALPHYNLLNTGYVPVSTEGLRGQLRWKLQTSEPFSSSPTTDGVTVYASTGDRRVVALDAATGALRWQAETTGPVDAAPVAAGDLVYVGLRDKRVLALDRATGALRWEYATDNPIIAAGVVSQGVLYQGSGDGKLYALDAATGARLWSFDAGSWVTAPPTVLEDQVIVTGRDGWIHFLDRATGQERFLFHTGGALFSAPAVTRDRVYVTTEARRLFAVDIHQRSTPLDRQIYWLRVNLWIWQMAPQPEPPKGFVWAARLPGRTSSSAALAHGLVYVGSEANKLLALDQETGKVAWELALPASVLGNPTVTEDTLYVGSDDGRLYAVDPRTGQQRWWFQTGGKVRGTPAVANGLLYFTSEDGVLYALG